MPASPKCWHCGNTPMPENNTCGNAGKMLLLAAHANQDHCHSQPERRNRQDYDHSRNCRAAQPRRCIRSHGRYGPAGQPHEGIRSRRFDRQALQRARRSRRSADRRGGREADINAQYRGTLSRRRNFCRSLARNTSFEPAWRNRDCPTTRGFFSTARRLWASWR